MTDENKVYSLSECMALWKSKGVKNLDWLSSEDPATLVSYTDIPDIIAMFDDKNATIPGWQFMTSKGEFRFIIKDNYLYPETVFEENRGAVNHRSHFHDIKYDIATKLTFSGSDSTRFRTNFGFGFAQIAQQPPDGSLTVNNALMAWHTFADRYHDETSYLINEYHRRASFVEHIGVRNVLGITTSDSLYEAFNETLSYLVRGDEYLGYINNLYLEPNAWIDIDKTTLDAQKGVFMNLWDVPGAQPVLSKLAVVWNLSAWSMMETLVDTLEFPRRALKGEKDHILTYVTNALGMNSSTTIPTLPSFY